MQQHLAQCTRFATASHKQRKNSQRSLHWTFRNPTNKAAKPRSFFATAAAEACDLPSRKTLQNGPDLNSFDDLLMTPFCHLHHCDSRAPHRRARYAPARQHRWWTAYKAKLIRWTRKLYIQRTPARSVNKQFCRNWWFSSTRKLQIKLLPWLFLLMTCICGQKLQTRKVLGSFSGCHLFVWTSTTCWDQQKERENARCVQPDAHAQPKPGKQPNVRSLFIFIFKRKPYR